MKSKLSEMRKKMYLSVNKLATLTGVPRALITRIEEGDVKEITLYHLKSLCIFFGCGIEDIIYFEEVA